MKKILLTMLLAMTSISLTAFSEHRIYVTIDSGGILGVIPTQLIKHIEEHTKTPIHKLVNGGFVGTSTGAIISSLLASPLKAGNLPYSASEVLEFYKTKSQPIFSSATTSVLSGLVSKKAQINAKKDATASLRGSFSQVYRDVLLSDSLAPLLIVTHNKSKRKTALLSGSMAKVSLTDAVHASCAIDQAFGGLNLNIDGDTDEYIDAASVGVRPHIIDPTNAVIKKIARRLKSNNVDTATIISLGTGFKLQERSSTTEYLDKRLKVIRINPDISHLIMDLLGPTIGLNLLSSNTDKANIDDLVLVAERMIATDEFQEALSIFTKQARTAHTEL